MTSEPRGAPNSYRSTGRQRPSQPGDASATDLATVSPRPRTLRRVVERRVATSPPPPVPSSATGMRSRRMSGFVAGVFMLDLLIFAASLVLARVVRVDDAGHAHGAPPTQPIFYVLVGTGLAVLTLTVLVLRGAYERSIYGAGTDEYKRVIVSVAMSAGVVAIVCYLFKIEIARSFLALSFPVALVALVCGRFAARRWLCRQRARGLLVHRILVVGGRSHVGEMVAVLRRAPSAGYAVVGACLPDPQDSFRAEERIPVLGGLDAVPAAVRACGADSVAVTTVPGSDTTFLRRLSWSLERSGVDLLVLPSLTEVAGPRIQIRPVAGLPLLHVDEPEFTGMRRVLKSAFDRIGATLLLLALSPALVSIAAVVRFGSRGPVLFRQTRVGTNGKPFECLKFRSMVVGAESEAQDLVGLNDHDGIMFKMRDDPRVTSAGRWLRRYSLDELPQLINVIAGQMSLVGPRPPLPGEVTSYGEDVLRRLLVKPGMTGLWQISGRSDLSWDTTVRLDLYYVENWSLIGDLLILAKTVRAVLSGAGAY